MANNLKKLRKRRYIVIATEIVQENFTVTASNKEEALRLARSLYRSGQLVLEPGELIKVKFEAQVEHRGTRQ